jgi:oxidoreductase
VLGSAHFTRVCEAGRRLTPLESFPEHVRAKLDQRKIDFDEADSGINDWKDAFREGKFDVVFIA